MKSRIEWLQELPEPYRSQAIENCLAQNEPNEYMLMQKQSLKATVLESFVWKNTGVMQGWIYWNRLYQTLCLAIVMVVAYGCSKDELARPVSPASSSIVTVSAKRYYPLLNKSYQWQQDITSSTVDLYPTGIDTVYFGKQIHFNRINDSLFCSQYNIPANFGMIISANAHGAILNGDSVDVVFSTTVLTSSGTNSGTLWRLNWML